MGWIKDRYNEWFGEKKTLKDMVFEHAVEPPEPVKKIVKTKFTVEYLPLSNRYYPKYGDNYLQQDRQRGTIEKIEAFLFAFAEYGRTEEEALKLIALFKEQRLKENVKVIEVDGDELEAGEYDRPFKVYDIANIQKVYSQHNDKTGSVVYSTDGGYTWQSVGMDSGKWSINEWLFAFIK